MIRVLQAVNDMRRAGLETMLMNYYRNIDRNKVQFDFLTHRPFDGAYDEEIRMLGGKIYHAPRLYPQNYPQYFKYMKKFFEEHSEYQIIHSHIDTMSYFPLKAAENSGIPIRIAHSHSSKLDKDMKLPIKYWALKKIPSVANQRCACGELAGNFMYPNHKFKIVRNAIDVDKFVFNENVRNRKRKELNVEGKYVVGHVGRYCYIKNQLFLIDIFDCIRKKKKNCHLLLIGKGEDQNKLEEKIAKMGLQNEVSLLIDRADVNELYQTMDIFVMPSLFEGLPLVGVEAQTNGLPCIVSDKISEEVIITSNIKMLNLKKGAEVWADEIIKMDTERNVHAKEEIIKAGYDIKEEAMKLQNWYLSLSDSLKNEEENAKI